MDPFRILLSKVTQFFPAIGVRPWWRTVSDRGFLKVAHVILSILRTPPRGERLAETYEFLVVRKMFRQPPALAVAGEGRSQHAARSEISLP